MTAPLPDQEARDRIRDETDATLFVEAGAGSGKTQALIDRVVHLVLTDHVPVSRIATVTFTEKAGAELRDRLRDRFERAWREARNAHGTDHPATRRAAEALDELDGAAIGTLHSFAQRILTLHPIQAGLPPLIEVLDEVSSSVAFDERWAALQRELLDDDSMTDSVLLGFSAGVTFDQLRSLARAFGADWDLIEDRVLSAPAEKFTPPDVSGLVDEAARLAACGGECSDDADKFLPRLEALRTWGEQLAAAVDIGEQLAVLLAAEDLKWGHGQKAHWPDLDGLRADCKTLQSHAAEIAARMTEAAVRPLARWIAERVRAAAYERSLDGRLEFHDLLVLARDLLRRDPDVRAALHEQFQVLLLDEFQDTDPIQIELAVRIAGGAGADAPDWRDIAVPAGSLFLVGDPKQSIYRFRRADIGMYLTAQRWVSNPVGLTTNFRTVQPVVEWVNAVFATLIQPVEDAQPAYQPLDAHRHQTPHGPGVVVLGTEIHDDKPNAERLRIREAADVAAVIQRAVAEQWTVYDEARAEWRTIALGDIAILLPARTSLPFLEEALDDGGIAYRAESSSLVYQAAEVRDLMAAARVVADPSDQLSCVAALRSPLFGCGDDDLWTWKRDGGSFTITAPVPDGLAGHPVAAGVEYLRRLHYRSRWMTPSEVLADVVTERRMLELAATGPRVQEQWRRLRFVVDQARAWSEVEHGGMRGYLAWASRQADESSRVAEAVLPETDVDAVGVMTVHSAKGLEFPMVVLSGMTSQPRRPRGVQLLWTADGYEVRLTKSVQTNDFEATQPVDEQMDEYERRRLLYVAATRARDHLVVSLHRKPRQTTNAALLAGAGAASVVPVEHFAASPAAAATAAPVRVDPPPDWDEWWAGIETSRRTSRSARVVNASGLEGTEPDVLLTQAAEEDEERAGTSKGSRDVELPPWSKGRYGSAVGRAVHGVLQVIDLADGSGLDSAVQAQCLAEGVTDHADVVADLVRSALGSDVVRRAAAREHWRESYVGAATSSAPVDGELTEGFVDLIYREDDGSLVIVDYKTDAIPAEAIPARRDFYAPQIGAYRHAVATATGRPTSGTLLFLHPSSDAVAVPVPTS